MIREGGGGRFIKNGNPHPNYFAYAITTLSLVQYHLNLVCTKKREKITPPHTKREKSGILHNWAIIDNPYPPSMATHVVSPPPC